MAHQRRACVVWSHRGLQKFGSSVQSYQPIDQSADSVISCKAEPPNEERPTAEVDFIADLLSHLAHNSNQQGAALELAQI